MKSDIWSIGVLFYELLYGVTPWTAQTEKELQYKISTIAVSFPSNRQVRRVTAAYLLIYFQNTHNYQTGFERVERLHQRVSPSGRTSALQSGVDGESRSNEG